MRRDVDYRSGRVLSEDTRNPCIVLLAGRGMTYSQSSAQFDITLMIRSLRFVMAHSTLSTSAFYLSPEKISIYNLGVIEDTLYFSSHFYSELNVSYYNQMAPWIASDRQISLLTQAGCTQWGWWPN
jgi:nicotinamide riboside transporter PnuC